MEINESYLALLKTHNKFIKIVLEHLPCVRKFKIKKY